MSLLLLMDTTTTTTTMPMPFRPDPDGIFQEEHQGEMLVLGITGESGVFTGSVAEDVTAGTTTTYR